MRTASGNPELLFGELAQALAARALDPRSTSPEDPRAVFALRAAGLSEEVRAELSALPSAVLGPARGPRAELLFECDALELEALAAELPEAALLLALHSARRRPIEEPLFMGVVNVTPDSFSDGGQFLDPQRALERGLELEAEGAAILDVGGESSRPGGRPVPEDEELARVLPVVEALAARTRARISIDTTKSAVARAAVERGASLVNDVSAGRADPAMLPLVAELGCELVLMHRRGTPADMQRDPRYADPVAEVADELRARVRECLKAGIELRRMTLDPGIGFGKRLGDNLDLLRRLPELRSLGLPVCVGASRKSFIAHATGRLGPSDWEGNRPRAAGGGADDRSGGTAAAVALCALAGVDVLRVHEVARMREAARIALAIHARPDRPLADMPPSRPTHDVPDQARAPRDERH